MICAGCYFYEDGICWSVRSGHHGSRMQPEGSCPAYSEEEYTEGGIPVQLWTEEEQKMTLYEINDAIQACLTETIDPETGEFLSAVLDPDAMDALQMAKAEKVENIGCWVKNLIAEAEAMKAEEERLAKRRKAAENKAKSLKEYLAFTCCGERFRGVRADVSFRQTATVAVYDMSLIPQEFIRTKVTTEPDKVALKKALTAGAVPGAHLGMSVSTIIK